MAHNRIAGMEARFPALAPAAPAPPPDFWADVPGRWIAPEAADPPLGTLAPRDALIGGQPHPGLIVGVLRRADGALFVQWFISGGGGDFHTTHELLMTFWVHGVKGTIACYEAGGARWNSAGEPRYVPKRDWPGDSNCWRHSPNWAIRGPRGAPARVSWTSFGGPAPDVRVRAIRSEALQSTAGMWSTSVTGTPGFGDEATFARFIQWLDSVGPRLRQWIEEDAA